MIRWIWSRMMKWGWDFSHKDTNELEIASASCGLDGSPVVRINMYQAMNGKIIEVHTPVANHRHSDWNTEHMVLQDGENLHDMIATLLITKGIK